MSIYCRCNVLAPDGREYPSVMAAYQAQKLCHLQSGPPAEVERARARLRSCGGTEAKRIGQKESFERRSLVLDVERWHSVRERVMSEVLGARAKKDARFRRILALTGTCRLRYIDSRDKYWSSCLPLESRRERASDVSTEDDPPREALDGEWLGRNRLGALMEELRGALSTEPARSRPTQHLVSAPPTRAFPDEAYRTGAWAPEPRMSAEHGIWAAFVALMRDIDGVPHVLVCMPGKALRYPGKDGVGDRGWHLPGGRVDSGEVGSLDDTARREFSEEIGVALPAYSDLREYTLPDKRNPRNNVRLYELWLNEEWEPPKSSKEMRSIAWIALRDLIGGGSEIRLVARRLAEAFLGRHLKAGSARSKPHEL